MSFRLASMVDNMRRPSHRIYYGWVIVLCAAWAMAATLPGRTIGLSLITEPLLASLNVDHITFARLNFISILIGAAFCIPLGSLMDRVGARRMLAGVCVALGA